MTTQTEWAHLPNVKYIDMILADLRAHPDNWGRAGNTGISATLDVAEDTAWNTSRTTERAAAVHAVRSAVCAVLSQLATAAARTARWAILALTAYDDCAYMLDCDPNDLELLAKLGDYRAILLLPACIVFKTSKIDK